MIELCDQIRRGNILMAKPIKGHDPCYLQVVSINRFSVTTSETEEPWPLSDDYYDKVLPVPISDKIKVACGFTEDTGRFKIDVDYGEVTIYLNDKMMLHDLQNIYQDLTGEILKIKLELL